MVVAYQVFQKAWDGWPEAFQRGPTFLLVVLGWVVFRSESLGMAVTMYGAMLGFAKATPLSRDLVWLGVLCTLLLAAVNLATRLDGLRPSTGGLRPMLVEELELERVDTDDREGE